MPLLPPPHPLPPPDCKITPTSKQGADLSLAAKLWEQSEALLAKALAGELKHLAPAKQDGKAAQKADATEAVVPVAVKMHASA